MMEASTRLVMARRIPIRIWLLRLGVLPPARLIRWVSGLQSRRSTGAGIEKLTAIGRHGLRFCNGAMRTGDDRFKDHGSSATHRGIISKTFGPSCHRNALDSPAR